MGCSWAICLEFHRTLAWKIILLSSDIEDICIHTDMYIYIYIHPSIQHALMHAYIHMYRLFLFVTPTDAHELAKAETAEWLSFQAEVGTGFEKNLSE